MSDLPEFDDNGDEIDLQKRAKEEQARLDDEWDREHKWDAYFASCEKRGKNHPITESIRMCVRLAYD